MLLAAGTYTIYLNISGTSSSEYTRGVSTKLKIISDTTAISPIFTSAQFSNDGKSIYFFFDSSTNQAGYSSSSQWTCSAIFSFTGASLCTCYWLNSTTVAGTFPSTSGSGLLEIGDSVTVLGSKVYSICPSGVTCNVAAAASKTITSIAPSNPISPNIIINVPSQISICANVTIDPTSTTGNGGRDWKYLSWTIFALNGISVTLPQQVLSALSSTALSKVILSRFILDVTTYYVTLTATNYLGVSASSTVSFVFGASGNLPTIQINGLSDVTIKASSSLSLFATSILSPCSTSSSSLQYAWTVYLNNVLQSNLKSTSKSPLVFSLSSYTLTAGNVYKVQLSATSQDGSGGFVSAYSSVNVAVSYGNIVAQISGGYTRLISTNTTLDASSSYDEATGTSQGLTFSWSCSIASLTNYGSSCNSLLQTTSQSSTIIRVNLLDVTTTYLFQVVVTSSDGRYSSSSVTVTRASPALPVVEASITTASTVSNQNSDLVVIGNVKTTVDTTTIWTASIDGSSQSLAGSLSSTKTTFTKAQVANSIAYPLFLPGNIFNANIEVVFRFSIYNTSLYLLSYAELTVRINGAPTGGIYTVTPQNGTALTTTFEFLTQNWVDSDLPLTYAFQYQLSSTTTPLNIQGRSQSNSVSRPLPAGLQSSDYALSTIAIVYDVYLASSNTTEISYVSPAANIDFAAFLTSSLTTASLTQDSDQSLSVVNVVGSVINLVDCSMVNTTYCSSLNREPCTTTANTCGSCKTNYTGIVGSHNTQCSSIFNSKQAIGGNCTSNQDCIYNLCDLVTKTCAASVKSCPSNSTFDTCSSHGYCYYSDGTNEITQSQCTLLNTLCIPKCICTGGYGGIDCSLDAATLAARQNSRVIMCNTLQSVLNTSDPSSDLIESITGSMLSTFNPSEVTSVSGTLSCQNALKSVVEGAKNGYLKASSTLAVQNLVSTISNFIKVGNSSALSNTTSGVVEGMLTSMVSGQSPIEVTSDALRLYITKSLAANFQNATFTSPKTAEEITYGVATTEIRLLNGADTACNDGTGYTSISFGSWSLNPLANASNFKTSLFRSQSYGSSSSTSSSSTSNSVAYQMIFPFALTQAFTTLNTALLQPGIKYNYTIPKCTQYASDGSTRDCIGCELGTYTNTSVTFNCYDITQICGSSASRRRLQTSSTPAVLNQAGAIVTALVKEFTSILSSNPFAANLSNAKPILAFVGCLILVIFGGAMYFWKWDRMDRRVIIYAKAEKKIADLAGLDSKYTRIGVDLSRAWEDVQSVMASYHGSFDKASVVKEEGKRHPVVALSAILNASIPLPPPRMTIWDRIVAFFSPFLQRHAYTIMFGKNGLEETRLSRWFSVSISVMFGLFMDTLLFSSFFPDDGTCENYLTKSQCIAQYNSAAAQTLCIWSGSSDTDLSGSSCSLNPPPSDITFAILLSTITLIFVLPTSIFIDFIRTGICNKRPDLEAIGLTSSYWLGTERVVNSSAEGGKDPKQKARKLSSVKMAEKGMLVKKSWSDLVYELHDQPGMDIAPSIEETSFVSRTAYSSLASTEGELDLIFKEIKQFYSIAANRIPIPHHQSPRLLSRLQAKVMAIYKSFGITPDNQWSSLTLRQSLLYGNAQKRLMKKLNSRRRSTNEIVSSVGTEELNGSLEQEVALLQSFILEQFGPIKRYALRFSMFEFPYIGAEKIHPVPWLLGWIFLVLLLLFFVYWTFAWAIKSGSVTFVAWGTNFGLSIMQDIVFVQILMVYFVYLALWQSVLEQLESIYYTLFNVALRIPELEEQGSFQEMRVVQYLSPACRAARMQGLGHLKISRLLHHLDDLDIVRCRDTGRQSMVGIVTILLVGVPALLSLFSFSAATIYFQTILPFVASGVILVFYYLYVVAFGAFIVVGFFSIYYLMYSLYGTIMMSTAVDEKSFQERRSQKQLWELFSLAAMARQIVQVLQTVSQGIYNYVQGRRLPSEKEILAEVHWSKKNIPSVLYQISSGERFQVVNTKLSRNMVSRSGDVDDNFIPSPLQRSSTYKSMKSLRQRSQLFSLHDDIDLECQMQIGLFSKDEEEESPQSLLRTTPADDNASLQAVQPSVLITLHGRAVFPYSRFELFEEIQRVYENLPVEIRSLDRTTQGGAGSSSSRSIPYNPRVREGYLTARLQQQLALMSKRVMEPVEMTYDPVKDLREEEDDDEHVISTMRDREKDLISIDVDQENTNAVRMFKLPAISTASRSENEEIDVIAARESASYRFSLSHQTTVDSVSAVVRGFFLHYGVNYPGIMRLLPVIRKFLKSGGHTPRDAKTPRSRKEYQKIRGLLAGRRMSYQDTKSIVTKVARLYLKHGAARESDDDHDKGHAAHVMSAHVLTELTATLHSWYERVLREVKTNNSKRVKEITEQDEVIPVIEFLEWWQNMLPQIEKADEYQLSAGAVRRARRVLIPKSDRAWADTIQEEISSYKYRATNALQSPAPSSKK